MKWGEVDKHMCSVARVASIVGEPWTLLILRDAFSGIRRFDEFQRSLGVTRHLLSKRLRKLIDAQILTKISHSSAPHRREYRLTRRGLALYPVMMTLSQWGDDWLDHGEGPPIKYTHIRCGKQIQAVLTCGACGERLRPEEVSSQLSDFLANHLDNLKKRGEGTPTIGELTREASIVQKFENKKSQ